MIYFDPGLSFSRSAYLNVFSVWSADDLPGDTQAIMTTLHMSRLHMNESLSTIVNLFYLNGMCSPFDSMAQMHSFKASSDWLISAPSCHRCLLFDWVSCAHSEPARSTNNSLPLGTHLVLPPSVLVSNILIVHMACDLLDVSLLAVACVCHTDDPYWISCSISCGDLGSASCMPLIMICPLLSSCALSAAWLFNRSYSLPYISKYDIVNPNSRPVSSRIISAPANRSLTAWPCTPSIVYVLPEPVCPYAKHVTTPPSNRKSICGWMELEYNDSVVAWSPNVLSIWKPWLSTNLVIPSTLYLHSWTMMAGLVTDTMSISPSCSSFWNTGRLRTQMLILLFAWKWWGYGSTTHRTCWPTMTWNSTSHLMPLASFSAAIRSQFILISSIFRRLCSRSSASLKWATYFWIASLVFFFAGLFFGSSGMFRCFFSRFRFSWLVPYTGRLFSLSSCMICWLDMVLIYSARLTIMRSFVSLRLSANHGQINWKLTCDSSHIFAQNCKQWTNLRRCVLSIRSEVLTLLCSVAVAVWIGLLHHHYKLFINSNFWQL